MAFLLVNIAILLLISNIFHYINGEIADTDKKAYEDGDFLVGILLPIHKAPDTSGYSKKCGAVWEQYGIHRLEVIFLTLDEINGRKNRFKFPFGNNSVKISNNPQSSILPPGITLGIHIRDECWQTAIALEQAIKFLPMSIIQAEENPNFDDSLNNIQILNPKNVIQNSVQAISTITSNSLCKPVNVSATKKQVRVVIGPGSSTTSIQVQNVLQLFHMPQIGYSATAKDLSDKGQFPYFLRVAPPDNFQALALVDICKHFGWNYVSAVNTKGLPHLLFEKMDKIIMHMSLDNQPIVLFSLINFL